MTDIKQIIKEIENNENVRKNVLTLKNESKEKSISIDSTLLKQLLKYEDVKVRKNTCILIHNLQREDLVDDLVECLFEEENWIVKNEIIETLHLFNLNQTTLDKLNSYFKNLTHDLGDNQIHIETLRGKLFDLLRKQGCYEYPQFKDIDQPITLLFTGLDTQLNSIYEQVDTNKKKITKYGVVAKVDSMYEIETLRDYKNWYVVLLGIKNASLDLDTLPEMIIQSNLFKVLNQLHDKQPFAFRIDSENTKKENLGNDFVRRLGLKIQELSNGKLYNSTSDYDIEFCLLEGKNKSCQVLLKCDNFLDERFAYRQFVLPTSMQPYLAASIIHQISSYIHPKAKIIDLCCGTGTLLIERNIFKPCTFSMGVDLYGEAIKMARHNSYKANLDINYVQRDFESFQHIHQFDEVYGDLPVISANQDRKKIEKLYMDFMNKAIKLVNTKGHLFIYTTEIELFKKVLRFFKNNIEIQEEIQFTLKNTKSQLFILKMK